MPNNMYEVTKQSLPIISYYISSDNGLDMINHVRFCLIYVLYMPMMVDMCIYIHALMMLSDV